MSFYGDLRTTIRSPFVFDAIYSSRYEMESKMYEDNIYNGRFVLIDYGEKTPARYKADYVQVYIDYFNPEKIYYTYDVTKNEYIQVEPTEDFDKTKDYYIQTTTPTEVIDETVGYGKNRKLDFEKYHGNYDATIWQKVWRSVDYPPAGDIETNKYVPKSTADSKVWEKYILVAELNAQAPRLTLVTDAPADDAQPHFDMLHSSSLDYRLHMPRNWRWSVDDWTDVGDVEKNIEEYNAGNEPTNNIFYYNEEGFDPSVRSHIDLEERPNKTYLTERISGAYYPTHDDVEKTSQKCVYNEETGSYDYVTDQSQVDTKVLGIDLPGFGNIASKIWDMIYSGPDADDGTNRKTLIKIKRLLEEDEEGKRILYDGSDETVTLAGFLNFMLDSAGKPTDDVFAGELANWPEDLPASDSTNWPIDVNTNYRTWYGYFNALRQMFGDRLDTTNNPNKDKFYPIYDPDVAASMGEENYEIGLISEDTFNSYLRAGCPIFSYNASSYDQIKYKIENDKYVEEVVKVGEDEAEDFDERYYIDAAGTVEATDAQVNAWFDNNPDNNVQIYKKIRFPDREYSAKTKYYTVALSFWAYLNDVLRTIREAGQPDWENDYTGSNTSILHRPDIIYNFEPIIYLDSETNMLYYQGWVKDSYQAATDTKVIAYKIAAYPVEVATIDTAKSINAAAANGWEINNQYKYYKDAQGVVKATDDEVETWINTSTEEYVKAGDITEFTSNVTYYIKQPDRYTAVENNYRSGVTYYIQTTDGTYIEASTKYFESNQTYYTKNAATYTKVTGNFDATKIYYVTEDNVTYIEQKDLTEFADGVTYYTKNPDTYTEVKNDFDNSKIYYIAKVTYIEQKDLVKFEKGVTYYTKDGDTYIENKSDFDSSKTYYIKNEYEKFSGSYFLEGVTYYLKQPDSYTDVTDAGFDSTKVYYTHPILYCRRIYTDSENAKWFSIDENGETIPYEDAEIAIDGQLTETIVEAFKDYRYKNGMVQDPNEEGYLENPAGGLAIEDIWSSVSGDKDVTTSIIYDEIKSLDPTAISDSQIGNIMAQQFFFSVTDFYDL